MTDSQDANVKHAIGKAKPPSCFTPPAPLAWLDYVMWFGANRSGKDGTGYGWFNWCDGGVTWSTYFDATTRHLRAMLSGEDTDPQTSAPHAAHIMGCMVVLLDAMEKGNLKDDRPTRPADVTATYEKIAALMADGSAAQKAPASQVIMEGDVVEYVPNPSKFGVVQRFSRDFHNVKVRRKDGNSGWTQKHSLWPTALIRKKEIQA